MSCKYNNCKHCGYKSECEIFKENTELKEINSHTLSQLNLDNGELIIENEKLKKENAELKKEANYKIDTLCLENAELKEKLGDIQIQKAGEKSDLVWKLKTANEQKAEKLTEAKEIIKDLLNLPYASNEEVFADVDSHLYRAEQFLKE